MNKFLAQLLIQTIGLSACGKSIYASTALVSAETESRRDSNPSVATPFDGISPALHESMTVPDASNRSAGTEVAPSGQASPGTGQKPPPHHGHHARNILIGLGAMCILAVVIAVAAK